MQWLIASLIPWLTDWLIGWLIGWLVDSSSDSLIHCFVPSSVHWFTDSLIHWSLIHLFIGSLIHSVSCAWILSCPFIGISTTICSFVGAPHNFKTSLLLHLESFPIGRLLPIVVVFFRNFRPGAGRALVIYYIILYMFSLFYEYFISNKSKYICLPISRHQLEICHEMTFRHAIANACPIYIYIYIYIYTRYIYIHDIYIYTIYIILYIRYIYGIYTVYIYIQYIMLPQPKYLQRMLGSDLEQKHARRDTTGGQEETGGPRQRSM